MSEFFLAEAVFDDAGAIFPRRPRTPAGDRSRFWRRGRIRWPSRRGRCLGIALLSCVNSTGSVRRRAGQQVHERIDLLTADAGRGDDLGKRGLQQLLERSPQKDQRKAPIGRQCPERQRFLPVGPVSVRAQSLAKTLEPAGNLKLLHRGSSCRSHDASPLFRARAVFPAARADSNVPQKNRVHPNGRPPCALDHWQATLGRADDLAFVAPNGFAAASAFSEIISCEKAGRFADAQWPRRRPEGAREAKITQTLGGNSPPHTHSTDRRIPVVSASAVTISGGPRTTTFARSYAAPRGSTILGSLHCST